MSVGGRNIITDGLVYMIDPFNEKSYTTGTSIKNIVTDTTQGSLTNGASYSPTYQAWDLDGVNDYVTCNMALGSLSNFTYIVWVRPDSTNASFRSLGQTGPWSTTEFALFYNGTTIRMITKANANYQNNVCSDFTENKWNQVGVVNTSTHMYLYCNGTLRGTLVKSNTANVSLNNVYVGQHMGYGYLSGQIGLTSCYNKNLSESEMLQNYETLKWRFN